MEEFGKKVNKLSLAMLQMKGMFSLLMIPGARSAEKSICKLLGWRGPKKKTSYTTWVVQPNGWTSS
jgi:hypothetical protein